MTYSTIITVDFAGTNYNSATATFTVANSTPGEQATGVTYAQLVAGYTYEYETEEVSFFTITSENGGCQGEVMTYDIQTTPEPTTPNPTPSPTAEPTPAPLEVITPAPSSAGTFTLSTSYGMTFDNVATNGGSIPEFSFPVPGYSNSSLPMVDPYSNGSIFEATITGTFVDPGGSYKVDATKNGVNIGCTEITSSPGAGGLQVYITINDIVQYTDNFRLAINSGECTTPAPTATPPAGGIQYGTHSLVAPGSVVGTTRLIFLGSEGVNRARAFIEDLCGVISPSTGTNYNPTITSVAVYNESSPYSLINTIGMSTISSNVSYTFDGAEAIVTITQSATPSSAIDGEQNFYYVF